MAMFEVKLVQPVLCQFSYSSCSRRESLGVSGTGFYRHDNLSVNLTSGVRALKETFLDAYHGVYTVYYCFIILVMFSFLFACCMTVSVLNLFMLGTPYAVVITSPRWADSSSVFKIQWEMMSSGGLPIIEYEFKYRRVSIETD